MNTSQALDDQKGTDKVRTKLKSDVNVTQLNQNSYIWLWVSAPSATSLGSNSSRYVSCLPLKTDGSVVVHSQSFALPNHTDLQTCSGGQHSIGM